MPTVLTTSRIAIVEDTYVRGGADAGTNYSTGGLLHVCNNTSAAYDRWGYVKAQLGGVSTSVDNAILRINARLWTAGTSPMAVYAVSDAWQERTLTWNNRPMPQVVPLREFTILSANSTWYELDVTAWVAEAKQTGRPAVAFVIRQLERNGPLAYVNTSNHHEFRPELVVRQVR